MTAASSPRPLAASVTPLPTLIVDHVSHSQSATPAAQARKNTRGNSVATVPIVMSVLAVSCLFCACVVFVMGFRAVRERRRRYRQREMVPMSDSDAASLAKNAESDE